MPLKRMAARKRRDSSPLMVSRGDTQSLMIYLIS